MRIFLSLLLPLASMLRERESSLNLLLLRCFQLSHALMCSIKYDNKNTRLMLCSIKNVAIESFLSDGMSRTFMT